MKDAYILNGERAIGALDSLKSLTKTVGLLLVEALEANNFDRGSQEVTKADMCSLYVKEAAQRLEALIKVRNKRIMGTERRITHEMRNKRIMGTEG